MWDKVDKEMGEERERELNATYWRSSLDRGCTTSRFLRTRESAFDIIEPLIEAANGRSSVLFQNELVDMRKTLPATSPGLELFSTMEQLVSQREDLLRRIRFEMRRSDGNKMTLEPLQEEHQKLQRNLEVTITEMRKLPLALEQRFLITTEKFLSSNLKIESLESLIVSKRLSTPNTHQSPAGSISHTPLPVANGSNVFLLEQGHTSDTDRSTPTKPEEKQSQTNHSSLSTTKEQAQDNTVSSDQITYSTRHGSSPVGPAYVKCNRGLPSPVFLLEQGPTSDTDRSKPTNPEEKRSQTNHSSVSTTTGKEQAQDSTVSSGQTTLARSIQLIADRLGLNKKPAASDTDSKLPSLPIDSYISVSHADRLPTGAISKDPNHHIHQSPAGSTSHTPLPIANGSNIFLPLGQGPTSGMVRTDQSKPLASSIVRFPPPPFPADATSQSRTHTVLQGTINALKLVQQIIGLAPVPGLQSLVGVVLNISEAVNVSFTATHISHQNNNTIDPKNMYAAEDALVELAQKAGSFMLTLVSLMEQGSPISTFSDPDSMNSVIEGLTKCVLTPHSYTIHFDKGLHREMNRVLRVVNKISSQRLPKRLLLSASDKAAVDECNRQMTLACGIFGVRKLSTSSQSAQCQILITSKLDPNCVHLANSHGSDGGQVKPSS